MEFTDHYEIEGEIHYSRLKAVKAAFFNEDRVWFVRDGGDCECTDGCDCEWTVELSRGQIVNCMGFYVTTEPCRPEHRDEIFTY